MAPGSRRAGRLATAAVAAIASLGWFAGGGLAAGADGKVRAVDPRSQTLVAKAEQKSSTVAALVAELEQTDVVVMVQVTLMPMPLGGDMRMLSATASCRYLIVRLDASRSPEEQMEFFGHELQHATEVAAATDVRDEAGLAKLMARIGRATGRGTFETDAAVRVSRLVRQEVRGR